jgi:15-cis-phytoene synthase
MIMSHLSELPERAESAAEMELVRRALRAAAERLEAEGLARPELAGQLIRPLVSLAGWRGLTATEPTPSFWWGVLAVQLAHEASLLHDDVLDGAPRRRGAPTVVAGSGVGIALVQGDHLLTTAYRCATRTHSPLFVELFARSVERTVAGEIRQGRAAGTFLTEAEYEAIARGKAGELLGCALAVAPALLAPARTAEFHDLGSRFGVVYQMLDDLLDLCPSTDTGKPALSDYAQRHWTWPLAALQVDGFAMDPREIVRALHSDASGAAPIQGCVARLTSAVESLEAALSQRLGGGEILIGLLQDWRSRGIAAVEREAREIREGGERWQAPSGSLLARVPDEAELPSYFARHSRSFSFATRFFSSEDSARVARVYAFCRCTDDLADEPGLSGAESAALLDEWLTLSRRAYAGHPSGISFLDRVMTEMSAARVPFRYVEELVEGMRMDLRGERYASLGELRRYTYRVASVVGLWISELFDVRDRETLRRAEAMGHAMQLTNIIRDVGEDLRAGRCYLPADLMRRHGISEQALLRDGPLPAGYPALVEELIAAAEAAYRVGFEGIRHLPRSLRMPVGVAAHVYRGILREVRLLEHDNVRHRARTSTARKLMLATRALMTSAAPWRRGPAGAGAGAPRLGEGRTS